MTKVHFSFIIIFLLLLAAYPLLGQVSTMTQTLVAMGIIMLFGVPHGAIDNILFLEKSSMSPFRFYAYYIGAIVLNVVSWFLFPAFSLCLFLAISSYHFGQSQFVGTLKAPWRWSNVLYFFWGMAVILSFVYFNTAALKELTLSIPDLHAFEVLINQAWIMGLFVGSILVCLALLLRALAKGILSTNAFAIEIYLLALICLLAYLTNFIIGFTLFFTIIHSFKVFQSEYNHFYPNSERLQLVPFLLKLLPLSLVSFVGAGLLFGMIHLGIAPLSYPFAILLSISSITLPHVFVMERFYANAQNIEQVPGNA
jgi:Brp/Blh family beta-carotene 15,15'-monooxygenase